MKSLFFPTTSGTVHVSPYTDASGKIIAWFVGTKNHPVMAMFNEVSGNQRQQAITYAIENFNITPDYLNLYCLALNNGWDFETKHNPGAEAQELIGEIQEVLMTSAKINTP